MTDFVSFLEGHIYVPVIAGIFLLALIILLTCWCYRRSLRSQYLVYQPLNNKDVALYDRMYANQKEQSDSVKDEAWMNGQYYLRSHQQYDKLVQLEQLGSRSDKHWFRVTDQRSRLERLLSISRHSSNCVLPFNLTTRKTLSDLFNLLRHPYIYPIIQFDFVTDQQLIAVIQPICNKGSLKDFIYQSRYTTRWHEKYLMKHKGLNLQQIALHGKQILQGLIYMEDKGFPSHGHLHSGNIMYDNSVCRIGGYENSFLGLKSKIALMAKKKIRDQPSAIDVISFGHVFYEMCTGCELDKVYPEPSHLSVCTNATLVTVLNFIFGEDRDGYPSLQEICELDFFKMVNLAELNKFNPAPISLSSAMKSAIKSVKTGKLSKKSMRRSSSTNKIERSTSRVTLDGRDSKPPSPPPPGGPPLNVPPPPPPPPPLISPGGPPPAPPPPPPSSAPPPPSSGGQGRAALLSNIRSGTKLKKTVTNDRSAPKI